MFTLVCSFNENKLLCTNCFAGSNGHEFVFLLKGHEDLRQDERVMQLFGLVNTLLANDPTSLRKNLRCVLWVITESACPFGTPYTGAALQINHKQFFCEEMANRGAKLIKKKNSNHIIQTWGNVSERIVGFI